MKFLKLVMVAVDHKGGRRTTRTMWATRRRWTSRKGYEKKDEEMGFKITKEKPFFPQYVPILLNGTVKVYVVVMKVVNGNNDEGEKKSNKRERQGYEHI